MLIKVGCEFCYESAWTTPAVMQVEPRADGDFRILHEEWQLTPPLELHAYRDMYGNTCRRMVIPAGDMPGDTHGDTASPPCIAIIAGLSPCYSKLSWECGEPTFAPTYISFLS